MKYQSFVAALSLMAAFSVQAQVEVVDSQPLGGRNASPGSQPAPAAGNEAAHLYFQLQTLQQEVQELRGLVEEQAYELKKLKQQRLDDYLDLDRRLGQLSQGGGSAATATASSTQTQASAPAVTKGPKAVDELKSYRAAIDLVIKKRDYDQATAALNQYLMDFPEGHYAANAKYWLGQIYMQKEELDQSAAWFNRVAREHPTHAKTSEAKFKLGKVYHLQGKNTEAKSLLEEVSSSGGSAAGLASSYLKQNF